MHGMTNVKLLQPLFYVLLTVYPGMILANNQLDAQTNIHEKLCVKLVIYKDDTTATFKPSTSKAAQFPF